MLLSVKGIYSDFGLPDGLPERVLFNGFSWGKMEQLSFVEVITE